MKFIKQLDKTQKFFIALSGGVDSVSLLHFCLKKRIQVTPVFFDHGDELAKKEEEFVKAHCENYNLPLLIGHTEAVKGKNKSPKEFWREERYKFLDTLPGTILLGHTFDDVVESWVFYMLRVGEGRFIPYQRNNCIRPWLGTNKEELKEFCTKNEIEWFEDPTNEDRTYTRNLIRHDLLPLAYQVNPGLKKVIMRKMKEKLERENV